MFTNALLWVDEGPIRARLQAKLTELSAHLSTLESSRDDYFSADLPQFQSWVNERFADDLRDIAALEKRVLALGHHIEESMQLSLQMNMHPSELFAETSEGEILEKIFSEAAPAEDRDEEPDLRAKCHAGSSAREIFRRIARGLHPDLRDEPPSECEKNLWVKAQRAYAENDVFELQRIELCLRCGTASDELLSCSELLGQLEDFKNKADQLKSELSCLQSERAWGFRRKRTLTSLEREIETEYRAALRDLRAREQELHRTLRGWLDKRNTATQMPKAPRRRNSKNQASLFDL